MSMNQSSIKVRSFNIGKRERIYQGDKEIPQKMRFLDFYLAIFKENELKDALMEKEKAKELQRRYPKYEFNGDLAFHNPSTKFGNSNITLSDIIKHKNDFAYYEKNKLAILQIIPYNSSDYHIRQSSIKIIQDYAKEYNELIVCCLSFFGLQFVPSHDISIDDRNERKNIFENKIDHLFMKTLISSLYLYNQHYSVVLYSYYCDKMEDGDDFDYKTPFHLSLFSRKLEDDEEEKEDSNKEEVHIGDNKDENEIKEEIKPSEQHFSIEFSSHNYDCVLSKNRHIYEPNMIVYKVCNLPSIIKKLQLIEGIENDILNDIKYFCSFNIDGFCKCISSLSFPKSLLFYPCDHEINLRYAINEHIINENVYSRELIIRYLYGLLIPICNLTSIQIPIIHKNINPDNVYFTNNNNNNNNTSTLFHISGYVESRLCPNRIISRYIPPEVKEGREIYPNCDVYSVMIIILELLDGWIINGQIGLNEQTLKSCGDLKGIFDMMVYPNLQRPTAYQILSQLPK